jgi:long-subunit fatty acid transport protein
VSNWTVDAAYYYVDKQDRTVSNQRVEGTNLVGFNGTWSGDAHLVALDVGYRF